MLSSTPFGQLGDPCDSFVGLVRSGAPQAMEAVVPASPWMGFFGGAHGPLQKICGTTVVSPYLAVGAHTQRALGPVPTSAVHLGVHVPGCGACVVGWRPGQCDVRRLAGV